MQEFEVSGFHFMVPYSTGELKYIWIISMIHTLGHGDISILFAMLHGPVLLFSLQSINNMEGLVILHFGLISPGLTCWTIRLNF